MRYYEFGRLRALVKIGMVSDVGPIAYASSRSRDSDLGVENKKQDFWKSIDDEPSITGNESGIGMPSAPKTGSELGYGSSVGTYDIGGSDANQHLSDRDKRLSDAMQNAFTANTQYDQSYAPEAASTQPYGPKLAAAAMRIAAPKPGGNAFGVPRLGGRPGGNTTMGMQPTPATTIKPPTGLSPQHSVAQNAFRNSRTNVHAQQPNAVGAVGSRISTIPTVAGGAPVNPVNMAPKMPDMTTTAPRV
jgi:hypothetical protein